MCIWIMVDNVQNPSLKGNSDAATATRQCNRRRRHARSLSHKADSPRRLIFIFNWLKLLKRTYPCKWDKLNPHQRRPDPQTGINRIPYWWYAIHCQYLFRRLIQQTFRFYFSWFILLCPSQKNAHALFAPLEKNYIVNVCVCCVCERVSVVES